MVSSSEKHPSQGLLFAEAVSRLLGWSYFLLWSASFWPQALTFHRRKTVAGMSLDFLALNILGFLCYATFNLSFLLSPTIQDQYRRAHGGQSNVVRWNDAFFALHAVALSLWQGAQAIVYQKAPGQKISWWAKVMLVTLVSLLAVGALAASSGRTLWLAFVNLCAQVKLFITFVKYMPQIALNAQRRSTRGFAILNIVMDFGGSILSFAQLALDSAVINHDWSGVTGDIGKFGLSVISLIFDIILLTQHYVLFGDRRVEAEGDLNDAGRDSSNSRFLGAEESRPLIHGQGHSVQQSEG